MSDELRRLGQRALDTAAPAVPFVVHSAVSAAAFTAGLAATQLLGYACRISCATPVLGPVLGCAGIGAASVLAGQASQRWQQSHAPAGLPLARAASRRQDMLLDAVIGVALWKAMGGRFRSVLPSDLFAPGALAVESLPSPGSQYASEVSRGELARLFRRDGCHHCGTRSGGVVGDHIPPNRMVWGSSKEWGGTARELQRQLARGLGLPPPAAGRAPKVAGRKAGPLGRAAAQLRAALQVEPVMPRQRYYPQCKRCSGRQSGAVRAGRRTLVWHFGGPRVPYFAGVIVGLRHFQAGAVGRPSGPSGRQRWRRPGTEPGGDAFGLRRLLSVPALLPVHLGIAMQAAGEWVQTEAGRSLHPELLPLPWPGLTSIARPSLLPGD